MTTEEKALALVNEVRAEKGLSCLRMEWVRSDATFLALCRAIEAHEADKKAFSDAVKKAIEGCGHNGFMAGYIQAQFAPFILPEPEPDPLVEALKSEVSHHSGLHSELADRLRQALAARGWKLERIDND